MGTRRFSLYREPDLDPHKLGQWARGGPDETLLNASVATYAETRRNILAINPNIATSISWSSDEDFGWSEYFKFPIGPRLSRRNGSRQLKIWMLATCSSEVAGHTVRFKFRLGYEEGEITFLSLTTGWQSCTITLREGTEYENEWCHVWKNADDTNTITIEAISMYQPEDDTVDWWDVDNASCVLGDADYPDSALARRILRDNVVATRNRKTVRNNVYNHWMGSLYKTGSYGANNDELGRYKVCKRAQVETIKIHCLCQKSVIHGDWTLRVEFNGQNDTATISATALTWYTLTLTMAGADITNSIEDELILDGDDGAGGANMFCVAVVVVEDPPAAISHTVPTVMDAILPSKILAETWDELRTTINHLYLRGGCSIIMQDFRNSTGTHQLLCNDSASPSKQDYGSSVTSLCARAVVFPSTGVKRVRVRMGFYTLDNGGTARVKHITIQLSDSLTFTTWDDVHELYEDFTNGDYQFDHDVSSDDEEVIGCELDVASGDWETHDPGGGQPLQVFINAWTDNVDEYVIPNWITIEEVVLQEADFP